MIRSKTKENFKILFIIIILCSISMSINSQNLDTIRYDGILGIMHYESIELYPNNRFKWSQEYDLSWSEFGTYELSIRKLTLKYFYLSEEQFKDSIEIKNPYRVETFLIEGNQLYRLNHKGKKIKRIRDKSYKTKWSWLLGHKYRIRKK